jgi:hypothetical protein
LALLLSASVQKYPSDMMVTAGPGTDRCSVWTLEKAMRTVRTTIEGLPDADESTRAAIGAVITERAKTTAGQLRTTST